MKRPQWSADHVDHQNLKWSFLPSWHPGDSAKYTLVTHKLVTGGFDQMGATLANAARLEQAGVEVAIGMDTHNIRLAAQHAGNAVANGLSYEAGLASLTRVPAKILGLDSQIGVLAKDARADIVVWSGDPLEVTEAAEMVIINGQFVDMESRQTKLRDRYLSLMQSDAKKPSYYYR